MVINLFNQMGIKEKPVSHCRFCWCVTADVVGTNKEEIFCGKCQAVKRIEKRD
jgi:hypothetical protein